MNPMNNVKGIENLNKKELELGLVGTKSSWHYRYRHSAWIFVGGFSYDMSEGDIICVFSQYGEVVNINLPRDRKTGKVQGFGFICYEDQRSTDLAVDNFNGTKVLGRTLRVDHVDKYKEPKDRNDYDEATNKLHSHGCAPKPLRSSSDESSDTDSYKKNKSQKRHLKRSAFQDDVSDSRSKSIKNYPTSAKIVKTEKEFYKKQEQVHTKSNSSQKEREVKHYKSEDVDNHYRKEEIDKSYRKKQIEQPYTKEIKKSYRKEDTEKAQPQTRKISARKVSSQKRGSSTDTYTDSEHETRKPQHKHSKSKSYERSEVKKHKSQEEKRHYKPLINEKNAKYANLSGGSYRRSKRELSSHDSELSSSSETPEKSPHRRQSIKQTPSVDRERSVSSDREHKRNWKDNEADYRSSKDFDSVREPHNVRNKDRVDDYHRHHDDSYKRRHEIRLSSEHSSKRHKYDHWSPDRQEPDRRSRELEDYNYQKRESERYNEIVITVKERHRSRERSWHRDEISHSRVERPHLEYKYEKNRHVPRDHLDDERWEERGKPYKEYRREEDNRDDRHFEHHDDHHTKDHHLRDHDLRDNHPRDHHSRDQSRDQHSRDHQSRDNHLRDNHLRDQHIRDNHPRDHHPRDHHTRDHDTRDHQPRDHPEYPEEHHREYHPRDKPRRFSDEFHLRHEFSPEPRISPREHSHDRMRSNTQHHDHPIPHKQRSRSGDFKYVSSQVNKRSNNPELRNRSFERPPKKAINFQHRKLYMDYH